MRPFFQSSSLLVAIAVAAGFGSTAQAQPEDSATSSPDRQNGEPGGLVPPTYPFGAPLTKLPESDGRTQEYVDALRQFLSDRLDAEQARVGTVRPLSVPEVGTTDASPPADVAFGRALLDLNGPIFWAPASQSADIITRTGDEIRAVFGPIPPFNVASLGTTTSPGGFEVETAQLGLEVKGNFVELKPNPSKPNSPLEWEHKDLNGQVVKWTTTIDRCDKPSLAGGVTPCGTSSRISRTTRGDNPVKWIALARKTRGQEPLESDPYWLRTDPTYALVGYIGFNPVSGEVAFLDGSYPDPESGSDPRRFDWNELLPPPGGSGYLDSEGRDEAAELYDDAFRVDCAACHDNREPIIITPYIKHARVGYRDAQRRDLGSVGDLFPENLRNDRKPYRVVGTAYTAIHGDTLDTAMSIGDPSPLKVCTECHGITNKGTGRFSSDAVGRLGDLPGDNAPENQFRTSWAERSGLGKIHPWMVPFGGQDISQDPPPEPISEEEWEKLKAAIVDPSSVVGSKKIYTRTPAPGSPFNSDTLLADPSQPIIDEPKVLPAQDQSSSVVALDWVYANNLGGVPERDDVRFNVAIREVQIPENAAEPSIDEYPSLEVSKGEQATRIADHLLIDSDIKIVENISYQGHEKFTDPSPASHPRQYSLKFPASPGNRYLIRVVPKRFGFDRGGQVFGETEFLRFVDVPE